MVETREEPGARMDWWSPFQDSNLGCLPLDLLLFSVDKDPFVGTLSFNSRSSNNYAKEVLTLL